MVKMMNFIIKMVKMKNDDGKEHHDDDHTDNKHNEINNEENNESDGKDIMVKRSQPRG